MFVATLAIAGIPPFAGFFSKDAILFSSFQSPTGGRILYAFGLLTALLTALYMFRLIFLTFNGKPRYDEKKVHVHESPSSMLGPLVVLAILSVIGGWFALPAFFQRPDYFVNFLTPVFGGAQEAVDAATEAATRQLELILAGVAFGTALIGIAIAYWLYISKPKKADDLAKSMKPAYTTLLNKYYVDELYAFVIVRPLLWLSTTVFWKGADVAAIDGTVNGIARGAAAIGDGVRHSQSGNTRSYAVWVVVGAIVVLALIFWTTIAFNRPAVGLVR
jgi:NADH-quinone oxidoreductase subunit L